MTYTVQDPKPNMSVQSDLAHPSVEGALQVIQTNNTPKTANDTKVRLKRKLYDLAFLGSNNKYPRFLEHKLVYQAVWQTIQRMRPLDYALHGTGRKDWQEALVSAGVQTVMERGGLYELWRGKNGIAYSMCVDGDAILWLQNPKKNNKSVPITYNLASITNLYTDCQALAFRGVGEGRNATKAALIFSYSWSTFCRLFPEWKDKVAQGKIPREVITSEIGRTQINQLDIEQDDVEVCYYYDVDNLVYSCFAGASCTLLEELTGDKYPFKLHGQAIIPIVQFTGIVSGEGFYNFGLPDLLFDLSEVGTKIKNLATGHVWENTWPLVNLSIPQGQADKYVQRLADAYKERAQGRQGIIVNEYNPMNPYSPKADALLTPNMAGEWQAVDGLIDRDVQRSGVVLDSGDLGSDPTRYQLMAEEDRRTAFVKKMLEENATSFQAVIEYTMEAIKKCGRNNKTILNIRTDIVQSEDDQALDFAEIQKANGMSENEAMIEAETMKASGEFAPKKLPKKLVSETTLGWVAGELIDNNYFVEIDARSGAYTSELAQLAKYEGFLQYAPMGTKAFNKIMAKVTAGKGVNLREEDFSPAPPEVEEPQTQTQAPIL